MKEEPLMKNLIGQSSHKKVGKTQSDGSSYRIVEPYTNSPDMKTYRLDTINFDVPIRGDKVMNANIKANILSDEEMLSLGFKERSFYWEYKELVSFLPGMEEYLRVNIGKKAKGITINVFDEFLDIVYDYQSVLYDSEFDEYANRIHTNVQSKIMSLVDAGVITGYKRNDYI